MLRNVKQFMNSNSIVHAIVLLYILHYLKTGVNITHNVNPDNLSRSSLKRFAWLSIAAALVAIGLKMTAYLLTDSVGLLSDAMAAQHVHLG